MRRLLAPILLISLGVILIVLYALFRASLSDDSSGNDSSPLAEEMLTAPPALADPTSRTPQPIFPTPTTDRESNELATAGPPTVTATPDPRRCPLPDCLSRTGVSGRLDDVAAAANAGLPFGNYFDWWFNADPPAIGGQSAGDDPRYWQMVPVSQDGPAVSWAQIEEVLAARPGSIWIVGNEPDVIWQDNTTADAYAAIYHDVYTFIKDRDPEAQVAIAGVAQPSPLRLAYLERALDAYRDSYGQPMPVDIWSIHAFILREQAGSWGVGIPPGMEENQGLLYEIADHDDLEIFGQNLFSFRAWMAGQGYGDKPLAVTEFGILHPPDYGFPPPAVTAFMIEASEILATASGDDGLAADEDRLVQYWFWFSVHDHGDYPTGNLYDVQQDRLTAVGKAFRRYLVGR